MGGAVGFVFRFTGGLASRDGAGRSGRWSGGAVFGAEKMSGCGGGKGPCA